MRFEEQLRYFREGKFDEPRVVGRVYSILLAVVVFCFILVPLFVLQTVPVLQGSMLPTIAERGDSVGLLMHVGCTRGDIIVFNRHEGGKTKRLIKRVLACPGDRIRIADRTYEDGSVRPCVQIETDAVVDGRTVRVFLWLDEPYLSADGDTAVANPGGAYSEILAAGWFELKPHQYFVAGDHRYRSDDSFSFGPISGGDIIGRVICIYRNTGKKFLMFEMQNIEGLGVSLGYSEVITGV